MRAYYHLAVYASCSAIIKLRHSQSLAFAIVEGEEEEVSDLREVPEIIYIGVIKLRCCCSHHRLVLHKCDRSYAGGEGKAQLVLQLVLTVDANQALIYACRQNHIQRCRTLRTHRRTHTLLAATLCTRGKSRSRTFLPTARLPSARMC